MGKLAELVTKFFKDNNWEYEQNGEDNDAFRAGVTADNGEFDVVVLANDDLNQLTCFCIHEHDIPEARRHDVAEYIIRVNENTILGIYDMDFDDGTIRVRSTMNVVDMEPTIHAVEIVVHGAISTADVYFPGLQAVVNEEKSPEEALDDVIEALVEEEFPDNNGDHLE